jgi:hypothetical protein
MAFRLQPLHEKNHNTMKNFFAKTAFVFIITALLGIASCKDDPSPSKRELLTSGTGNWKLTGQIITAAGQSENVFPAFEPCVVDNIYSYSSDGSYEFGEGATKCESTDPDVYELGTWTIVGNLLITTETGSDGWATTIVEMSKTTMVLEFEVDVFGVAAVTRSTYTKQ